MVTYQPTSSARQGLGCGAGRIVVGPTGSLGPFPAHAVGDVIELDAALAKPGADPIRGGEVLASFCRMAEPDKTLDRNRIELAREKRVGVTTDQLGNPR